MTVVMQNLGNFMLYALLAMFVENAVFTRAFGVSRLTKLVSDSAVDSLLFCALLCLVQVISAPLAFFANRWLSAMHLPYAAYVRPLMFVLCAIAAFVVVLALMMVLPLPNRKELMAVLPMATFNCAILGPLLITSAQNYTFTQTVGFALGSGIGYGFAVLLLTEGEKKMDDEKVPSTFRGLPITLVYIGILALAIYGLTGHRLAY